jgi:hypothetical protein
MRINICLTILFLVTVGTIAYSQTQPIAVTEATEEDYSVATVKYLMKQSSGFSASFAEKQVTRLGDRVSIALLKIFDESDFKDSYKVNSVIPLIRASFLQPELIAVKEDRNPKITLFLLQKIESESRDAKLKADITQLRGFIRQKMASYQQKR